MNHHTGVFGRLARLTLVTCVRGLVQAVVSLAGLLLFFASLLSLLSLAAGIGILLAPKSLLAVRGLASSQRRWARQWSGVTIATPYRPRPVEITNGLIGRLQRCKWLLTDPATWRDLLWALAGAPVSVVLGLLPVFMVVAGLWTVVADGGTLLFGWWNTAPPGFWGQVFFLGMLPLGVVTGPLLLRAHAWAAASLLAPTREAMAAQVGQLAESRSQAVDASAAELRRIERDLHDGAQARLVSLGMNIGFAEQVLRDKPDLALTLRPARVTLHPPRHFQPVTPRPPRQLGAHGRRPRAAADPGRAWIEGYDRQPQALGLADDVPRSTGGQAISGRGEPGVAR
jgi:signal transduction histidine kinase